MNLAVCLAGCLDVTPLKSLLQVVPSCLTLYFKLVRKYFGKDYK